MGIVAMYVTAFNTALAAERRRPIESDGVPDRIRNYQI
jgi:hypothetical protein